MKKTILSVTMALMVGTTMFGAQNVALAGFGLPSIDVLGDGSSSNESKSPKVDVEGLTNRQNAMLQKLGDSVVLFSSAVLDIEDALGLNPKIIGEQTLVYNNLNSDRTSTDYMKKSAEKKIPEKEIKAAAKATLDSSDQSKIDKINEAIRKAELKKQAAYIYTAFAAKDAVNIAKEGTVGMKGFDGISKIQGIVKSAQLAQKICELQNKQINAVNGALKEYKASQNIQTPSDEEAQAAAAAWFKE